MIQSFVKSVVLFLITLVGITMLSFALAYLSPSDPAEILLTENGIAPSEALLEKTREELGLNRPIYVQYATWLVNFFKGDMGISIKSNRPVSYELFKALPYTLMLTIASMLLTILIAIPLGIACAKYQNSRFDRVVQMTAYVLLSFPIFFTSLILMYILSLKLKMLPAISGGSMKGLIMPSLALSFNMIVVYVRQIRAVVLREMKNDYVVGLWARGVTERNIFWVHILKNALTPIVTLTGMSLGVLLGGTIIVESIFNWPGIGKLAVEAIKHRDYPIIQGYVAWMAFIYFLVNSSIELLYTRLNPKMIKS
ncbi:ABC transporter permease [Geosporobacter ferrireducens]|uniref:Nickel ABC transporter permease subunit NikB n=1 Tax=Geosporobacter ferrireducens TaxID=1424294 RepID=A0A1D8GNH2_9FIRM|nr:ABC transporter permease [Geosporobacter ferrireducens]AOT72481.1 nickel ABC transporter permease subunit NikB [Geosporobacter ferrireducens]MTI58223.1 ABC transporter permease [Geosporobacter ferrireducens]